MEDCTIFVWMLGAGWNLSFLIHKGQPYYHLAVSEWVYTWYHPAHLWLLLSPSVVHWQSLWQDGGGMHHHFHAVVRLCEVTFSYSQFLHSYLHDTVSYRHFDRWLERLQRSTEALQSVLGQETLTFGQVSRWVVAISRYLPVSLQWRHWYWRFGHSFLRWWSRSRRKILISLLSSVHLFGQQRRAYSHVVRWSSRNRNSPTQSHPFSQLLHITFSDLISCSPTGEESQWKLKYQEMWTRKGHWTLHTCKARSLRNSYTRKPAVPLKLSVEQFWLKIETANWLYIFAILTLWCTQW